LAFPLFVIFQSKADLTLSFSLSLSLSLDDSNKEATEKSKLTGKWHPTRKGTLKRNYKVPTKAIGQKVLKDIANLLSEDDHFIDATSHKVFLIFFYVNSNMFF
jgi:hypothetical protein